MPRAQAQWLAISAHGCFKRPIVKSCPTIKPADPPMILRSPSDTGAAKACVGTRGSGHSSRRVMSCTLNRMVQDQNQNGAGNRYQ